MLTRLGIKVAIGPIPKFLEPLSPSQMTCPTLCFPWIALSDRAKGLAFEGFIEKPFGSSGSLWDFGVKDWRHVK